MKATAEFWRDRRVLITGHTGFMGGWLAVLLKELGAAVGGYALAPPTTPSFFDCVGLGPLLDCDVRGDVRDAAKLAQAVRDQRPAVIFHLAAQSLVREGFRDPVATFDVNVMGTVNALEAARAEPGVRAVVVFTTDKVYDNREWDRDFREGDRLGGRDPYGGSKACAELAVEAYRHSFLSARHVGVATVRAGNAIGGGDWAPGRLVPDIIRAFGAGAVLKLRHPSATRPWQHVLEPLRGSLMLAQRLCFDPHRHASGWNFGPARESQRPVSWIVEYCARQWGERARWEADGGAGINEALRLGLSSAKAEQQLGWKPLWGLDVALDRTLDWYRAHAAGGNMLEPTRAQIRETFAAVPSESVLGSAR